MMCDDSIKQESKRFYLGDDSDESEAEDEPNQRRYSISSGCSDDVVGGVPTNLNFDEDSGLGMSLDDDSNDSNDSQLLPLRPVNIGKCASSKLEHKQQRTRRGKKFYDFYEIKGHLGSGAYATVETCVSRTTGEEFAVKLVKKHEQGHTRSRILREVEVFKMCRNHPNIVQLQEWFEDEDYYYMVFEKMEGGPLLSQIQNKVCFNEQEAAQVTKNIANALKFLHSKHIAHRDLKPENVLCCSNSSVAPVKLCDLDLASKPSIHGIRRTSRQLQNVQSEPDLSSPVGSAEFLAPEVVETFVGEALKYNRQCDMWSLGIIIFVMLSGYTPFYGECENADNCGWNQGQFCEDCQENLFEKIRQGSFEFPPEEWDNISAEAKDLISHLLVKDARKRYTAVEVLNHPWIINAPETPLNTATNLCRNSSTKEIQQYNDQFNAMNHFVNRLSSRVEETIPSCGTSPENECALQDVYETSPQYAQEVVTETAKVLEKSGAEEKPPMINKQPEHMPIYTGHHEMQQHMFYYPPPPMVNMTGVFYGPPMVSNDHFGYIPPQHYYSQHQPYYMTNDYTAQYVNAPNYNHQGYVPVPFYNPATKLETVVEETPRVNQMGRVNSALAQHPLTPATDPLDASEMKKLQQHRGSLSAAISQLGLENCQNAMIRQGSASKEIYRGTREAEVNV